MSRPLSRRTVLRSGVALGASLALSPVAVARALAGDASSPAPVRSGRAGLHELPQPAVVRSVDGSLRTTLTARPAVVDMRAAQPVATYTYDGVVPGRTWEIESGDTLDFEVVNDLPPVPESDDAALTRPHAWTTTNIHTHGLHVSPKGNADNVFLRIPPGERLAYRIEVPRDHTGGLFWYHPHKHGGVAHQVRAGMAGALVVRGAIDEVEEVRAAREQLMVLQAIELGDAYELLDPIPDPSAEEAFFPRTRILYTVNGVLSPKVTMYPGEVQRWRILNAAEGKFMSLRLEGHELDVLAWDGLTLGAPERARDILLSAGNRVDLLVKAGRAGTYDLVLTPGSSQHPDIPGMPDEHSADEDHAAPPAPISSSELRVRPILRVEVTGSGPAMGLPTALPAYDPPIRPITRQRELAFTVQRQADGEFIDFGVNGFHFDPAREPYRMQLGTAERWTVYNSIDDKLPRHAHSFHIHVNPFRVTRVNGIAVERPFWRDTWVLTGSTGDSFTMEMNIDDFDGRFVEHCHVLAHEDLGMMEALEVVR